MNTSNPKVHLLDRNYLDKNTFNNWQLFIQKILINYPNSKLYLKGGAVIAINLLKVICLNKIDIDVFKQLDLINDFDFVLEDEACCNDYFYYEFGEEFNIYLNGDKKRKQRGKTTLRVMRDQSKKFELSVCSKQTDKLELPLTSMSIDITCDNFVNIFRIIDNIYDISFLNELHVNVPDHDNNGMFDLIGINGNPLKVTDISLMIKNVIEEITDNINYQQCLIYLVQNPTNISRLYYKNIPKSNKIKEFYQQYLPLTDMPTYLISSEIPLILNKFIDDIGLMVDEIYGKYRNDIAILTENIYYYDRQFNEYNCIYDLIGIGGSPSEVIEFSRIIYHDIDYTNVGKYFNIINSPCISKLIKSLDGCTNKQKHAKINNLCEYVNKINYKCIEYNIKFVNISNEGCWLLKDIKFVNISNKGCLLLRNETETKRDELRSTLTNLYIKMFQELDLIFEGVNIIRWKDSIKNYKSLNNSIEAINPITDIFSFYDELELRLSLKHDIIINSKILSTISTWSLMIELLK